MVVVDIILDVILEVVLIVDLDIIFLDLIVLDFILGVFPDESQSYCWGKLSLWGKFAQ